MCMYLVHYKIVDAVEHKFLVTGHSFLACDRDFALIEKRKRVAQCYDLEDLKNAIQTSCLKNPYKVVEMTRFHDFKRVSEYLFNSTKICISSASWIRIESIGVVKLKRNFTDLSFEEYNIFKQAQHYTLVFKPL